MISYSLNVLVLAAAQTPKTLDELYDAYEELLARKRQDEIRYRLNMNELVNLNL